MKIRDSLLDVMSATTDSTGRAMVGWRRRIEIHEDSVDISILASPDIAGIGIGTPPTEVTIQCAPKRQSSDPINWLGWLSLDMLEPGHIYWLELRAYGCISVEREDDYPKSVWYWRIPEGSWGGALCE